MTLKEIPVGQSAAIEAVRGEGALRRHLLDMGVIPGAELTVIRLAPMGDPMEIQIHGYELTLRLADLGAQALSDTVEMLAAGTAVRTPQEHEKHTYAPMLSKALSPIDWNRTARQIHDQVRGLIPWPCASTVVGGKNVKVFQTAFGTETTAAPGTVVSSGKQGIEIACGDGCTLFITQLQAEGGKRMAAADYLRGHSVQVGV